MGEKFLNTRSAAAELGVGADRLSRAVWAGRLGEPMRGPGGCFLWQEADLERAAWVLCRRALEDIRAERRQRQAVRL
jgi:hypothetical protein